MGRNQPLAEHARRLRVAVRNHAAADPIGDSCWSTSRAGAHDVRQLAAAAGQCWRCGWPGLLRPRAQPAPLRADRGRRAWRQFPHAVHGLCRALPGIGRSTAGAIAAFCYGVRAPILDANVRRDTRSASGADLAEVRVFEARPGGAWPSAVTDTDLARHRTATQGLMDPGLPASACARPLLHAVPAAAGLRSRALAMR